MARKSSRSARPRLLAACILLLAVGIGFLQIRNSRADRESGSSDQSSRGTLAHKTKSESSRVSHRKTGKRGPYRDRDAWIAEVLARNPGLEPEWRKVPYERNGFLQWLEFCEKHRIDGELGSERLDIPADIASMLSDPSKWDAEAIKAFLDGNRELLETIMRIGLLPDRSAADIDVSRWQFVGARFTKQCAELLMADARLAAESGDPERALRRVQAASGLAGHYDQVEAPSLLMETVSILIRLMVQDQVITRLLPAMDASPGELAAWREAIRPPDTELSAFSRILRGEGWVSLAGLVIPFLNGEENAANQRSDVPAPDAIPDADTFLDVYAQGYLSAIRKAEAFGLDDFTGVKENPLGMPFQADHLSEGAQELLDIMAIGASAWGKGWMRGMVLSARADAALAILQGEDVPLEPYTGMPYVYDPVARTLQVPEDARLLKIMNSVEPLKLP